MKKREIQILLPTIGQDERLKSLKEFKNGEHIWQSFLTYIMKRLQDLDIFTHSSNHAIQMLFFYKNQFGIGLNDSPITKSCSKNTMKILLQNMMAPEDYEYVVKAIKSL